MAIQRMEHVGIVVDDLAAATEFFVELGLEQRGKGYLEGSWVDRIAGLDGVRLEIAMLRTPDGHGEIELVKFHSPPTQTGDPYVPANTPGLRHLAFLVEDIDAVVAGLQARGTKLVGELMRYEDSYRALLRPRPRGDHRRAGREDRLRGPVRRRRRRGRATSTLPMQRHARRLARSAPARLHGPGRRERPPPPA